ncbi:MAG: DUF1697 domain-containing protein [Ignavibacteriales bacterium]|nr:DUF1697 domain-containing protein [Ignavibacteriales bacterium]
MKYLVLLKAINVAGKNLVPMEKLRILLTGLQFSNVQTYIQSGNIIFESTQRDTDAITKTIEYQLQHSFQAASTAFVYTRNQFEVIVNGNPFLADPGNEIDHLHLTFMQHEPDKELVKDNEAAQHKYIIKGKYIYLHCPNGYGNTKLTNSLFEKKLKITATTRNWKTVLKLREMMKE